MRHGQPSYVRAGPAFDRSMPSASVGHPDAARCFTTGFVEEPTSNHGILVQELVAQPFVTERIQD